VRSWRYSRDGVRVLVRGLPSPHMGGLAPSPRGRYLAYGEDATVAPGTPPQTQGL
jgi:hypothetical protein